MSNPVVNRTVNVYINQASAERSLESLQAAADRLNKTIAKGTAEGKDMTKQINQLATTKDKIKELSDIVSGKVAPSFRMVSAHVVQLTKELKALSYGTQEYADKKAELDKVRTTFRNMHDDINGVTRAMDKSKGNSFWSMVKGVAVGTLIGNTTQAIAEKIQGYFQAYLPGMQSFQTNLLTSKNLRAFSRQGERIEQRVKPN